MFLNKAITIASLLILALLGCGGGGSKPTPTPNPTPLSAPTSVHAFALDDNRLQISWAPVDPPFDGYELEGRMGTDPFIKLHPGLIAAGIIQLQVTLEPTVPESTPLEFRVRAVRTVEHSPYSPVSALLKPLRQPYSLFLSTGPDSNVFSWINSSVLADHVRIERSIGTLPSRPWTVLGSVSISAAARQEFIDDNFPDGEILWYRAVATTPGGESVPADTDTLPIPLRSPTALVTQPVAGGAKLSWINRSLRSPAIHVIRFKEFNLGGFPEIIATLPPGTTTFTDQLLPLGTYSYLVEASLGSDKAASGYVNFATPPSSTTSAESAEILTLPFQGALSGDPDKGWWLAGLHNQDGISIQPTITHVLPGGTSNGALERLPGFSSNDLYVDFTLVLAGDEPHLFSTVGVPGNRVELRHAWKSDSGWVSETIVSRDSNTLSLGGGVVVDGNLHLVWMTDASGLEHAVKINGSWVIESLPGSPNVLAMDSVKVAGSSDGKLVVGWVLHGRQDSVQLLRETDAGGWTQENVPLPIDDPLSGLGVFHGLRQDAGNIYVLLETTPMLGSAQVDPTLWMLTRTQSGWTPASRIDSLPNLGHDRPVDFAIHSGQISICLTFRDGMRHYLKVGAGNWSEIQIGAIQSYLARTGFDLAGNAWSLWIAGSSPDGREMAVVNRVMRP